MNVGSRVKIEVQDDNDVSYRIEAEGYYQRGRYSGPPERCYPDEGEVEVLRCVRLDDQGMDVGEVDYDKVFSAKRQRRIEESLFERISDDDYDGPDPEDDLPEDDEV